MSRDDLAAEAAREGTGACGVTGGAATTIYGRLIDWRLKRQKDKEIE